MGVMGMVRGMGMRRGMEVEGGYCGGRWVRGLVDGVG